MKRFVLLDFLMVLSVLVLAAVTVELLLPAPKCIGSEVATQTGSMSKRAAEQCIASKANASIGQREP